MGGVVVAAALDDGIDVRGLALRAVVPLVLSRLLGVVDDGDASIVIGELSLLKSSV
jgi:hypothetical protein